MVYTSAQLLCRQVTARNAWLHDVQAKRRQQITFPSTNVLWRSVSHFPLRGIPLLVVKSHIAERDTRPRRV
jgi:hypothetical protein